MEFHQLLAGVARGEREAQDELIDAFYPRVRAIVHRQLESDFRRSHRWILPLFSTRDIVQEVFAEVIRDLGDCEFADESALIAYLSTVVRNRLLDAVRYFEAAKRDSRRQEPESTRGVDAVAADTAHSAPPLAAALAEQAAAVQEVMQTFPTRHRELLRLRMVDDETFPAIARQLGYASAETARQAFLEAQAKLLVRLRARGIRPES